MVTSYIYGEFIDKSLGSADLVRNETTVSQGEVILINTLQVVRER